MHLCEIEAFLTIVRTGSLSKAAEELYITQPALSHRIKSLEKEIDSQLFLRKKGQRRIELTETGISFIPTAEKWQQLWEETTHIKSLSSQPVFRIASTIALSTYVMPGIYARFISRNLPVTLEVSTLHYKECYDAIERKTIDAVFASRIITSNRVSSLRIASERMVLLCSKNSPYSGVVSPLDLPKDKGIHMIWNHEYVMWSEYWFGLKQFPVYSDNMRLVEQIIATSDMWAIVPISVARSVFQPEALRYLELQFPPPERHTYLLTLEPQHEYTKYLVEDLHSFMEEHS